MTTTVPTILSVRDAVSVARYRVPIYQRAYAWTADEIETLVSDIRDARIADPTGRYFVGALVLHTERDPDDHTELLDIVDGQQRLTTITIMLTHPTVRQRFADAVDLPTIDPRLIGFEGRPAASRDLARIAGARNADELERLDDDGIRAAARLVGALVDRGELEAADIAHLLDHVQLVRTLLPARTDLNHYFEIMNSRGEQLEKHEIVKARLMERLDTDTDRRTFAALWDICSDLTKHVQALTPKAARTTLFGETWNRRTAAGFAQLGEALDAAREPAQARSILAILAADPPSVARTGATDDDDETPRYGAIIDFPNFLLQVLRLHVSVSGVSGAREADGDEVSLDDKTLVEQFERVFDGRGPEAVKRFAEELLETRFLFDNYVIRTDSVRDSTDDDSNWVIHRAHKVGEGRTQKVSPVAAFGDTIEHQRVLMLQAMYQVVDSRRAYKEFLHVILRELRQQWRASTEIDAQVLIATLEDAAAQRAARAVESGVDTGTAVQHFLFTYLDYLLWKQYVVDGELAPEGVKPAEFRFQYRKSVEHFYPVQPERDPLPSHVVNRFGNLCLMGRDENARRSNLMPTAKIRQYLSGDQSLKFQLMASDATAADEWGEAQIERHGRLMLDLIGRSLR
jgi:hypothetical protein